ncbi:MAG: peptidylprolyl isomerase [Clostridia bacterium]|nr:peptidylprolyl isomerase [Clostridia bacterium]MBQ8332243.1 peptidylprolyl isomerase [Clostridia bacterium]MBQ8512111.1 peptidylprolyl isomerase [Clostridia bacterium]
MKNFKKTIALTLAALTLGLTGCAAGTPVMTFRDETITENEYQFYLATYKSNFRSMYSDFQDTDTFYSSVLTEDGMTAGEYLNDAVRHNVQMSLICDGLFEEYGLRLSDSVIDTVDEYIADFVTEYAGGSKTAFNQALSQYGINKNMLREIYLRDERASAVFAHLFADGGEMALSDADRAEYLNENYVRVRHIYVNDKYTYAYDEEGYPIYTESGTHKMTALTDEEAAAKAELIEAIDDSLAQGGDFDEVYAAMSEDQYYKNGYYLTQNTADFITEVVDAAFSLEIGDYTKVESDYGTHYVMRMEMDESPWDDDANADFFTDYDTVVADACFTEFVESHLSEVVLNEEILGQYQIEDSPINSRF